MAPLPTSCWSGQGEKLVTCMFAIRFCMDSPTIIKNLVASGQLSWCILYGYASNIKQYQLTFIICGHTMHTFIKSFKFGNASQAMLMHKLSIENQTKITILVVKLDLIML